CSAEGFHCVSAKFKEAAEAAGFKGLAFRQIPGTPWYVINVTLRVNADRKAYSTEGPTCGTCKRPTSVTGIIESQAQIDVPNGAATFFSPLFDRGGTTNRDRDIFATEDIVLSLQDQGIKGGHFDRLLTVEEYKELQRAVAKDERPKKLKGATI